MAVRKNQMNLSSDEQLRFLTAWQNLNAQNALGVAVTEHSNNAHVLHSSANPPDLGSWQSDSRVLGEFYTIAYSLEQLPAWSWQRVIVVLTVTGTRLS